VTDVPPGTRTVLFKFLMHSTGGDGRPTGLYSARMEVDHQPLNGGGGPVDVTFRWAEVQSDRTLVERTHRVAVTSFPFVYDLNVCLSELQIFDQVIYTPFDIRIALPTVP
jgi:hypothetical protein